MARVLDGCWVLWQSAVMQFREQRGSQIAVVLSIVQPVAYIVVVSHLRPASTAIGQSQLVIGTALLSIWTSTVWMAGSVLRREAAQGTLLANMTAVWSPYLILVGKCLAATGRAVVGVSLATGAAAVLTGLRPRIPIGSLVLVIAATFLSAVALGVFLSCIFVTNRYATYVSSALGYPLYILSGVLIPLAELPSWVRPLSAAVSLYWIQRTTVLVGRGHSLAESVWAISGLTLAYVVCGIFAFAAVTSRARKRGTLDDR